MEPQDREVRSLKPLTPRQQELVRFIQGLPGDHRYTLTVICRGSEPWEIESAIESRKLGDFKPPPRMP